MGRFFHQNRTLDGDDILLWNGGRGMRYEDGGSAVCVLARTRR